MSSDRGGLPDYPNSGSDGGTSPEEADILIIGSGASGGAFAWSLSQVPGIKVVCLEQGDWANRSQFTPNAQLEQEKQLLLQPPEPEGVRLFPNGAPYDYSESEWQPVFYNGVGGSTIHYEGLFSRLHPSDFRVRTIDGVADDWPISYWDLEQYYAINDGMMRVAGLNGNTSVPPRSPRQMPPHAIGKSGEVLARGFDRLGWHWWPADGVVLTEPYGDSRQPCTNFCFPCREGCYRKARASTDIVYWPEAIRNGVALKTHARVREILVDKRGLAKGALYYDADGRIQEQRAKMVVVACNGIGTPRLLLNSKSSGFPEGLANSTGLVGKNLMGHPVANVLAQFGEELDTYKGPRACSLISEEFYESDPSRGFVRGHAWLCGRGGVSNPIAAASLGAWGKDHHRAFREMLNHTLGIGALGDDLPQESNRVVLDPVLTDDTGIPAPKLVLKHSENTMKIMDHAIQTMTEVLEAAGAEKILRATKLGGAAGHYLGTARMGDDPNTSVIDKWCRSHDVSNLFIIDGSVFVTSGTTTPTSTIQAIALRTADYIKDNARHLLD